ncbi:MAG: hypothetical protein A2148_03775 [Chloroflexi bacterium RBG_16_68_14]|nr:MAG: hypothetical protein A2148_03775 [Chloroflexi bacterium RBG_16_68_14]
MPYLFVHHKVEDFAKWKPAFDEHAALRQSGGSKGGFVFQNADDPNDVIILMEWDSVESARRFSQSDDLRQAMEHAGVSGPPYIRFLELADRPSV